MEPIQFFPEIFGSSDEETTALLLAQRPELLDAKDSYGRTILHWAARKGFSEISAQLLAQRPELANVLAHDCKWTPLHYAALEGHEAIVTQLLAHTSRDALLEESKWKALDCALQNGHDTIVGKLLDHCPELIETVTFSDCGGSCNAMILGHDKAVAQVLARRPKLDDVCLHGPASAGHCKVIALLLDYNPAFADATEEFGSTALHAAAQEGREKVVAQLLACSPKLIDVVDSEGNTALHSAIFSNNCKVLVQLLARKPGLIDAVNSEGRTPLQYALQYFKSSLTAIEFLLAVKPEQALRVDREGSTLLHLAVRRFCVLSCDETVQIERVWRLNPAAVRVLDFVGVDPSLHLAAQSNPAALLCKCFWEFSVDDIVSAFAMVGGAGESSAPHHVCLCILSVINAPLVNAGVMRHGKSKMIVVA